MPSTPLICSSSGAATVSAMTLGLAPGNCARTTTAGGTTSGYSEIGSWNDAITPPSRTIVDRTPAKIGRSMKNREMFMSGSRLGWLGSLRLRELLACHWHDVRLDDVPRVNSLQPIDHDGLARLHAGPDLGEAFVVRSFHDLPILGMVLGIDDQDKLARLVGQHRLFVDQNGRMGPARSHLDACVQTRYQHAIVVLKDRPHPDSARARIQRVVDGRDLPNPRVAGLTRQAEPDRNALSAQATQIQQIRLLVDIEVRVDRRH